MAIFLSVQGNKVDTIKKLHPCLCRFKSNAYVYNTKELWSFSLGWGNMDERNYILDNGFLFGVYETGPWLGAKFQDNPSMGWIGGGTKSYDIGVTMKNVVS